jgi:serine/threonine protein kinase/Tol biopolymer transport system component
MSLVPGSRIGGYEVTALIGEGGMGRVYCATDIKLNRRVAIKVLPDSLAEDPERLARFEREAKTLAILNHSNIAQIHGFEEASGVKALVMELVEGPTLAERIAQGPIPVDETLAIAKQIAEALEAAHEQGIVHRDLKPANIKTRLDGTVKVLDFGLAKAVDSVRLSPSASISPTITTPAMTQAGIILGTAAYMSPEQARGKVVDKRTDIWAFGCVLYEMLTGKRAFEAEDVSLTLAEVMKSDPDWRALPPLPPLVEIFLRQCLKKDPRQRVSDIHDVRLALEGVFDIGKQVVDTSTARSTRTTRSRWLLPLTAVVAAGLGGIAASVLWPTNSSQTMPPARFELVSPDGVGPGAAGVGRHALAFSPSGDRVAYFSAEQWFIRTLNDLAALPIRGAERGRELVFSPDGQSVAFYRQGELHRVALSGGAPVRIGKSPNPVGATWHDENTIIIGAGSEGIWKFPVSGGEAQQIVRMAGGQYAHGPQILPGEEWILFTVAAQAGSWDSADIVVQSLASGERKVVVHGGRDARYVPTGHLLYGLAGVLYGVAFDLRQLSTVGTPVSLVSGVMDADVRTGALHYSVSSTGSLAYLVGTSGDVGTLQWVSPDGRREALRLKPMSYSQPRVSPDGSRVALQVRSGAASDIHIHDSKRNAFSRLTTDGNSRFPLWTTDGQRVVFYSSREGGGLFSTSTEGGSVDRLTTSAHLQIPYSWSADGKTLIFQEGAGLSGAAPTANTDLFTLSLPSKSVASLLRAVAQPAVSPDGQWIAYSSNEANPRSEVYLRRFPGVNEGRWQISTDGGTSPLWSPDSSAIFFISDQPALMAASITTRPKVELGTPRVMLGLPPFYRGGLGRLTRQWDVTRHGIRFLILNPGDPSDDATTGTAKIVVALNWFEEVKRLVRPR